jgi:hypothetical protein
MANKGKEPSKMSQIGEFLSSLNKVDLKLSTNKIARAFRVKPATVINVAQMNPGQCLVSDKGKTITIIGEGHITSKTGHNVREDGDLVDSPSMKKEAKHRRRSRGRGVAGWLSGRGPNSSS